MKYVRLIALAYIVLGGLSTFGQAQRMEVSADYSLLHYSPAKSIAGSKNFNGGGGSFVYDLSKYFGIKADLQGYATTSETFHVTANPPFVPVTGSFTTQANMFSYVFGPEIKFPAKRLRIFGDALFGGAHTNGYAHLFKAAGVTGLSASNTGFALVVGGGVDLPTGSHFAIRLGEFDYMLTRFEWKPLGINNQSNFRYQAGIVFRFGGE